MTLLSAKLNGKIVMNIPSYDPAREKSLLHMSRHAGCIRDLYTVCSLIGLKSEIFHFEGPYDLSRDYANNDWYQNKDYYNKFDYVLTTDTTVMSRIFLQNLNELRGHLVIYISNRYDCSVEKDIEFHDLFRDVAIPRKDKVTIVPFCEFEKLYASVHGLNIWDRPVILPLGDWPPIGNEELNLNWEEQMYGPKGDPWAGRSISTSDNMFDTYYLNHYQNEQDTNLMKMCHEQGLKCFIGYAKSIMAFKAQVIFPSQTCNIGPFDAMVRGQVTIVPTHRLLAEAAKGNFHKNYAFHGNHIENATAYCTWLSYPECRIQFDSFDDLFSIMKNLDYNKIMLVRNNCTQTIARHRIEVLTRWRQTFGMQPV